MVKYFSPVTTLPGEVGFLLVAKTGDAIESLGSITDSHSDIFGMLQPRICVTLMKDAVFLTYSRVLQASSFLSIAFL